MLSMVKYLLRSDIRCSHSKDVKFFPCEVGDGGVGPGEGGAWWPLGGPGPLLDFFLSDLSFLPLLE